MAYLGGLRVGEHGHERDARVAHRAGIPAHPRERIHDLCRGAGGTGVRAAHTRTEGLRGARQWLQEVKREAAAMAPRVGTRGKPPASQIAARRAQSARGSARGAESARGGCACERARARKASGAALFGRSVPSAHSSDALRFDSTHSAAAATCDPVARAVGRNGGGAHARGPWSPHEADTKPARS